MKKVLIIGAKGMLGQELVKIFSTDKNYDVFGWDKDEIDITDEEQVKNKVEELAPEIIINAAAYNNVDKAEEPAEFEKAMKLNGLAPGYLARAAKEIKSITPSQSPPSKGGEEESSLLKEGEKKTSEGAIFVHYSSDYVFDGAKEAGYLEKDEPSPISNYGWSKLMGEKRVEQVGGQYFIIRLQKLFGWPAQSIGAKKSFFYNMLSLAKEKKELEVVDEELANFTYAPDLAERTKLLVESVDSNINSPHPNPLLQQGEGEIHPAPSFDRLRMKPLQRREVYPFGIYHITNEGRPATWFGAAKILFETTQECHPESSADGEGSRIDSSLRFHSAQNDRIPKLIPVSAGKFSRPAKRPKYSILLNSKLPPLRSWPEALKEFLNNL